MVNPLVNILLGAGEQYLADEDASDKLKGDIIDNVSKKLYDIEIPAQKANLNKIKKVKTAVTQRYGEKLADAFDNYGFYEDGNIDNAIKRIESFINKTQDTEKSFRNKVENQMSDEDFKKVFGSTSMVGARQQSLEDKEKRVFDIFSDRSNVRDLLISEDAPKEGIRGMLFGDRLKPKDAISARGKLEKATETREPDVTPVSDRQSIFDVQVAEPVKDSFLFSPAIPKYSTNELNTEIATQLQVSSSFDTTSGNILLQPEAQRKDEVNAVKEIAINNLYRFKEADGTGNSASAVKFARNYLEENVNKFLENNFENYTKEPTGAFGPITGAAIGIKDNLVTAAENFAADSGDEVMMAASESFKVIEFLANKAENLVGEDAINYYLSSIPNIDIPIVFDGKETSGKLRDSVIFTYNKNNARGQ